MKKILLSFALFTFLTASEYAQNTAPQTATPQTATAAASKPRKEMNEARKEEHKKMLKDAGITAEEAAKLKVANDEFRQKVKAIKDDKTLTPDQKKAQMHDLRAKRKADATNAIGTDKLEKLRAARKEHHKDDDGSKDPRHERGEHDKKGNEKKGE